MSFWSKHYLDRSYIIEGGFIDLEHISKKPWILRLLRSMLSLVVNPNVSFFFVAIVFGVNPCCFVFFFFVFVFDNKNFRLGTSVAVHIQEKEKEKEKLMARGNVLTVATKINTRKVSSQQNQPISWHKQRNSQQKDFKLHD